MPSQWVLLIALLGIAFYLLRAKPTAKSQAIRRLVLILALAGGVVLVLVPDLLFNTAGLLGIKEGSDLLLYLFIVAMMFYVVHQYRRLLWFDKMTTDLAREIALLRHEVHESKGSKGQKGR
jgi:hypothetical protein